VLALLAGLGSAPVANGYALVASTCQICGGNGVGDCETGPQVTGRGAAADMARFWSRHSPTASRR